MKNAIEEIIKNVPKGKIFDSHYVINQLISDYSDEYLAFASSVATNTTQNKTAVVHGLIAKEIKNLSNLVTQESGDFWSDNIRGNASECAGWRRI